MRIFLTAAICCSFFFLFIVLIFRALLVWFSFFGLFVVLISRLVSFDVSSAAVVFHLPRPRQRRRPRKLVFPQRLTHRHGRDHLRRHLRRLGRGLLRQGDLGGQRRRRRVRLVQRPGRGGRLRPGAWRRVSQAQRLDPHVDRRTSGASTIFFFFLMCVSRTPQLLFFSSYDERRRAG